MDALYARATAAKGRRARLVDSDRVKLAHAALVDAIVTAVPDAVDAAIAAGVTSAVVYEFAHEDMYDGVDALFLIRGPRRGSVRHHGVHSALDVLRRELAPFRVMHRWDQAHHRNYVVVDWSTGAT